MPISAGAGAIGGAGIGAAAGLAGSAFSAYQGRKEAKKNRDFQLNMSSTAHIREMLDLKTAGLNPILTATGGPGASTPGGATAAVPDYGGNASRGAAAGIEAATAKEALKLTKEQVRGQKIDNDANYAEMLVRVIKSTFMGNAWKNMAGSPMAEKVLRYRELFGDENISNAMRSVGSLGSSAMDLYGMLKSIPGAKKFGFDAWKKINK